MKPVLPVYARADGVWKPWWVPGPDGLADWGATFAELARLGWSGPVCLSGQYSDASIPVEERLRSDLRAAQEAHSLPTSGAFAG